MVTIHPAWLLSGHSYDDHTKLYHFAKRNYDANLGVWLIPDSLNFADGPNLYAYVHNNPLIYIDPYGLWTEFKNDLTPTPLSYSEKGSHN